VPPHTRRILRATHPLHAAVAMADGGATRGWLSAATRAALTEVGGLESRTVRLGAVNGPELEGPRLPRGPPHEAVSVQPVPVPEQLTVRVEAARSPAAETDLVINIIKHVIISVAPACITASRGLAAGIAPTSRDLPTLRMTALRATSRESPPAHTVQGPILSSKVILLALSLGLLLQSCFCPRRTNVILNLDLVY